MDNNLVLEKIKEIMNEEEISKVEINDTGQYNRIFFIDDKITFRVPKYEEEFERIRREANILEVISNHVNLKIPRPIYKSIDSDKVGEVFVGYEKISGKPLLKDDFFKIQDKQKLAKQLAEFLRELHSIDLSEVEDTEIQNLDNYNLWKEMYEDIQKYLFKYMREDAIEEVKRNFEAYLNNPDNQNFKKCIVHGDFGPTNILFEENEITGIIDFSSISISDPAIDFACMMGKFGYGEDFVKSMAEVYPEVKSYIERCRFFISTFALQDALFGIRNDDKEAFEFGIKDYR